MLNGWKTYVIAAMTLLIVIVEIAMGIDVPGIDVPADWLNTVVLALGMGTLRHGIDRTGRTR